MSNDIDGTAVSEGSEGDSDYAGDDSPFDESDYESSDDYEELEYDYELAEEPLPLEEVHCVPTFCCFSFGGYRISEMVRDAFLAPHLGRKVPQKQNFG